MESELGLRGSHGFHAWLMAPPAVTLARTLSTLSDPGNLEVPSSIFHRMNLTRFAFYCSSAVFSF